MWWRRVRYVLLLVALCTVATCPAAKRACTAKHRAAEADELLDALADRVAKAVLATGKVPPVAAGPTPEPSCCDRGGECSDEPALWDSPGWRALGFSVDGPFRFTYQYVPDPSGMSAIARATGDLDCNGEPFTVELDLRVIGGTVTRAWKRPGRD